MTWPQDISQNIPMSPPALHFSWTFKIIYSVEMQTLFSHLLMPAFLSSELPLGYYRSALLGDNPDSLWRKWLLLPLLEMLCLYCLSCLTTAKHVLFDLNYCFRQHRRAPFLVWGHSRSRFWCWGNLKPS